MAFDLRMMGRLIGEVHTRKVAQPAVRACRYRFFLSLFSHTSTGALTYTSIKLGISLRSFTRERRKGDIAETTAISPRCAILWANWPIRRTFFFPIVLGKAEIAAQFAADFIAIQMVDPVSQRAEMQTQTSSQRGFAGGAQPCQPDDLPVWRLLFFVHRCVCGYTGARIQPPSRYF